MLSGCAQVNSLQDQALSLIGGSPAPENLSPAQRRMREQSAAFNKTIWQGALTGAAIGGIGTWLAGGDKKDIVIGTAVGGVAGALAGAYVAQKQKEYAAKEDVLNSMISDARTKNQEAQQLISAMQEVIAEDKRKIAALKTKRQQQAVTEKELQQELAVVKDDRRVMQESISDAQKQVEVFRGAKAEYEKQYPGSNTAQLGSEIQTLQGRIDTMSTIADDLSDAELG
jgi:uncharacterized protein YcfJ